MKILLSGDFNKDSNNNFFIKHFSNLGVELDFFDDQKNYDENFPLKKRNLLRRILHRLIWKNVSKKVGFKFLEKIKEDKYDVIFIIKGWFYHPKIIAEIKRNLPQAKLICFNPDNPFNTWHHGVSNDWIRGSIPFYDVYFIWGEFLIEKLKKAGVKRVEYLSFAYEPEVYFYEEPANEEEKNYYGSDIVFIGTWDEEREWWLNHLKDFDLKIWGNDWNRANKGLRKKWMGKPAYAQDFRKICSASKICLNIIRKQNFPSHNMRTFEAPACRSFVLSTRTDEIKEFFEEDKEIVLFSTPEELREKINFYLENDELRKQIAYNGYQRVQGETYEKRCQKILELIKSL